MVKNHSETCCALIISVGINEVEDAQQVQDAKPLTPMGLQHLSASASGPAQTQWSVPVDANEDFHIKMEG